MTLKNKVLNLLTKLNILLRNRYPFIIFFILIFISLFFWFNNKTIIYWDASTIINPGIYLNRIYNTFSSFRFPGIISPQIIGHLVYSVIFFVLFKATNNILISQFLLYFILLFSSTSGFYVLLKYIFKNKTFKYSTIIAIFLSLFYTFNLFNVVTNWRIFNLSLFFYSFAPIALYYFLKTFENKKFIINFLFSLFLLTPGFSNIAYLPIFFVLLIIIYIINNKINFCCIIKIFKIIFISILFLSYLIIPQITLKDDFSKYSLYGGTYSAFKQNNINSSFINLFSGTFAASLDKNYYDWFSLFSNFKFILIVPIFLLLLALNNKKETDNKFKILVLLFLLIIILFVGPYEQLDLFWKLIFDKFPIMAMFRDSHQKFCLLYVILLTFIIFYSLYEIYKQNKKKYSYLFLVILVLIFIILNILPGFFGLFIKKDAKINLPKEINISINTINEDESNFSVLSIPLSKTPLNFFQLDDGTLYSSFDPIQLGTNKMVISNIYNNTIIDNDYIQIYNNIYNNNFSNLKNIKYIFINKRALDEKVYDKYKIEKIISNLNANKNSRLLLNNAYYLVFKLDNSKPTIDANNAYFYQINNEKYKIYFKNIKDNNDFSLISLYSKDWNLYLNQNPTNSWCEKLQEYNNDGNKITECKHEQKFFEGEELSYLYKKPIFQDSHKLVYDYANQWTIDPEYIKKNFDKSYYKENPDGSIDVELTLYFKPQSYFYLGLIISGTTLIGCVTYLIVDQIKNQKQKTKKQNGEEEEEF